MRANISSAGTESGSAVPSSQSAEIENVFKGSILRGASSEGLGWQGITLERRTCPPLEFPKDRLNNHYILLWDRHVARGERAGPSGKFVPWAKCPGTISLGVAGILPRIKALNRCDFIVCMLDPVLTESCDQGLDARPTASLHDRPGIEDEGIRRLLLLLDAESEGGGSYGKLYADALIQALATRFAFVARSERPPESPRVSALPRRILQRVLDRMQAEFSLDLDLATLAAESGYSRAHFLRMFRLATGETPHHYLQRLRLEHACRQLAETPASLIEVALECGFSSHSHFTNLFRETFGMTPSRYRRDQKQPHP
jgi:AraC family transcriptional regulator